MPGISLFAPLFVHTILSKHQENVLLSEASERTTFKITQTIKQNALITYKCNYRMNFIENSSTTIIVSFSLMNEVDRN